MNVDLGLPSMLAVLLGGGLILVASACQAADGGDTMNPPRWMGGPPWNEAGYGYGVPGAQVWPNGTYDPGPYGSTPYPVTPYGTVPGRVPTSRMPPSARQVGSPAAPAPTTEQKQISRIRELERRIGELEAQERRPKLLYPPLRHFDSAYGPHAP
jgi:hypothetical protein